MPLACVAAAITFSREPRGKLTRLLRWRGRASEKTNGSSGEPEEPGKLAAQDAVTAS